MARLIFAVLLLLLSLLAVFKAPAFYLWYLAIMVTEFPLIFLSITSIVLFWGIKVQRHQWEGTIACIIAFILFVSPIIRAATVAKNLSGNLQQAFDSSIAHDKAGFNAFKAVAQIGEKEIAYNTVTYSNVVNPGLTMDIYPSQLPGIRPCVIVVHGGSWAGGDSRQLPELNSVLAKKGYHVASINYRLAPAYKSPAPVVDVAAAISYLSHNAERLFIDTHKFILLGRSAGAQIVLEAAYRNPPAGVKGVVSFYGPADMIWGYLHPANPLIMNSCQVMEDFIGGTYQQLPAAYSACSPIEAAGATALPTLLIHGKNDPLVAYEHSTRLVNKLKTTGVKYYLLTLPWATHGCDYTLNGPSGQLTTYAIEQFLMYCCR